MKISNRFYVLKRKCCRQWLSIIFLASSIGFCRETIAQDIHLSQFFQAPLLRNPSLTGIFTGDVRVQTVYREQWNSVTDAYKTGSLDAEYKMAVGKGNNFFSTGLQIFHDRAGTISWTSTHILPAINYHQSMSNEKNRYLSLGFMGGWVQKKFDASKITTNSQYDGLGTGETFQSTNYSYFDAAIGMSYNAGLNENPENNVFVGVAYHHFGKPSNSFNRNLKTELPSKIVISGGIRFSVSEMAYMTMQADYYQQGAFREIIGGGMYGLKIGADPNAPNYVVHFGTFVRWNDALIPIIRFDYSQFSVSLSYDVNISKLKTSSYGRGGAELSLSYTGLLNRLSNNDLQSILCPKF